MSLHTKKLLISLFLFIFGFLSFLPPILQNITPFHTDEMYWIQTARILPYILKGKLHDIYWKEHMGFTNFNGAKWMYAFGLRLFGHTDFSAIGDPPFHYELWKQYDGLAFPHDHSLYPLLFHGRLISAFASGLAICVMFLLAFAIFQNLTVAITATLLLQIHPITANIATHALADSLFLFCELMILVFIVQVLQSNTRLSNGRYALLGMTLGLSVAVKINAAMFYILFLLNIMVWSIFHVISKRQFVRSFIIVSLMAWFIFLIIHPNFYFFPEYSLFQMITGRIKITQHHMAYFSTINPGHVLFTLPQRFASLWRNTFTPILLLFFAAGILASVILFIKRKYWTGSTIFFMQWINLFFVGAFLLGYVVFDEQRYFLPLLPLVCLIAVSWIQAIYLYASSFGRYWRASAI